MIIVHLTKFLRHGPYNRPVNGTLSHGNKMSVPSSTRLTTANQLALNVRSAKKANSGLLRRNLASGKLEDSDSRSLNFKLLRFSTCRAIVIRILLLLLLFLSGGVSVLFCMKYLL
jgi:hypothetical protein